MRDDSKPPEPIRQTAHPGELIGVDEDVWMDVIQKMDEVYSDLLQYEVALEEKNAELEQSQQFILSVLTSMSDILVICDRNGLIEDVNKSLLDFTGRELAQLRGKPIFELFAGEHTRKQARQLFSSHGDDSVHDCEMLLLARDGSPVPVSLNCTPRFNSVGKSLGLVVTGRPVGELRKAYEALTHAHEDLKRTQQQLLHAEKMASLGRLVAGVAHELNNPISFILGNVHAFRRYSDRLLRYLAAIHAHQPVQEVAHLREELRIDRLLQDLPSLIEGTVEGAERSRDIVDSLKRFSAIDRNEDQPFDLVEVMERAVQWVCKGARKNFAVVLDLAGPLMMSGSAGQLQQVVMNLVENAIDATAEVDAPSLTISGRREQGWLVVEFKDNGSGMDENTMSRVFEPFYTTKPVGQGTGLGLSISYGIVERHRGSLTVRCDEHGTIFRLALPADDAGGGP